MTVDTPIDITGESNRWDVLPFASGLAAARARWFLGCHVWLRAEAAQTGGGLGVIELLVPPGTSLPYHVHHYEDVALYVLEGAIRVFIDGHSWLLGAGGFAFLPRGSPHGFRAEGKELSRSLLIASPGGVEGVVAQLSSVEPPTGPPDLEELIAAAGRGGLELRGTLPE